MRWSVSWSYCESGTSGGSFSTLAIGKNAALGLQCLPTFLWECARRESAYHRP